MKSRKSGPPANLANNATKKGICSKVSNFSRKDSLLTNRMKQALEDAELFYKEGIIAIPAHTPTEYGCSCYRGKECTSPGKHPCADERGIKRTSPTEHVLKWISKYREINLAVLTGKESGILILDVDKKSGGFDSLKYLESTFSSLPQTWITETGGGGKHFWFKYNGNDIGNPTGFKKGIDIRCNGGIAIAPSSLHSSGNYYRWSDEFHPAWTELAPTPQWLIDLIKNKTSTSSKNSYNSKEKFNLRSLFFEDLHNGQRNSRILSMGGHLIARKVDPYVVTELMLAVNSHRCKPALKPEEIINIIRSICRMEAKDRGIYE